MRGGAQVSRASRRCVPRELRPCLLVTGTGGKIK